MARKPKAAAKAVQAKGDDATDQPTSSEKWINEIDQALRREDTWRKRAKKVIERFRDERSSSSSASKVNILWSNTEVLKAALYSRQAKPDVRRRFPDANKGNNVSRFAAEALERGLIYCADVYDVDGPIEAAIEDELLPGRGQCSVEYDPAIEGEGTDAEYVGEQALRIRYHYWEDFCHGLARQWCDVPWVAFRHAMRKAQFQSKFPDAKAGKDASEYEMKSISGQSIETTEADKLVEVWEVWDKEAKKRIYIARGYVTVLQEDDDPLQLTGFFPCPEPLYSVTTTDSLIPEPEYYQYQDQALELDEVSTRIRRLAEMMKWKGLRDGSAEGTELLADADDGEFPPVKNWRALAEKGGIENLVGFWPIERIIPVLTVLDARQASLIQKIYEITGISDIVRGATDPRETKGAQQLKAQFGSMRMQRRQRDVQRFIRDLYRLKAEIIAEHFTSENLNEIAALGLPSREEQQVAKMKIAALSIKPPMMPGGPPPGLMGGPPPQLQLPPPQQGLPSAPPTGGPPGNGGTPPPVIGPPGPPGVPPMGPAGSPPQPAPSPGATGQGGTPPPAMPGAQPPPVPPPSQGLPPVPKELQRIASSATWDDVMDVLRSDKIRGYRVDIETDSTVMQDAEAEKQSRVEFLTMFKDMLAGAYQAAITAPMMLPLIKESFLYGMRTFKAGRSMEQAVEDAFDELTEKPPAPPPGPNTGPDPAEMEAKKAELSLKAEAEKARLALEMKKLEQTAGGDKAKLQIEQARLQIEQEDKRARLQLEAQKVAHDQTHANRDLALRTAGQNKQVVSDLVPEVDGQEMNALDLLSQKFEMLIGQIIQGQQQIAMAQQQSADEMRQGMGIVSGDLNRIDGELRMVADTANAIVQQDMAPVEIVRGRDGKAQGIRKGDVMRNVVRGPDGRPQGLQ